MAKTFDLLIVDDAQFTRDLLRKGVRTLFPFFRMQEAKDGLQAQKLIMKQHFDLILCDWEMPEMSGAELLTWIRANESTVSTPFIMVTSRGDKEHVMKAIELKVNNYIVKPFNNDKLNKVISSVVQKSYNLSSAAFQELAGVNKSNLPPNMGLSGAFQTSTITQETAAAAVNRKNSDSEPTSPQTKEVLTLRFADHEVPLLLRNISSGEINGVMRREDNIPAILELVVIDITINREDIARLNGYIHTLQARDSDVESEFINVTLKLVDQNDPDKMAFIKRFIKKISQPANT